MVQTRSQVSKPIIPLDAEESPQVTTLTLRDTSEIDNNELVVRKSKKRTRKPKIIFSKTQDLTELTMNTFVWNNPTDGDRMKDAESRKKRRKVYNQRKQAEYRENRLQREENEKNWRNPNCKVIKDDDAESLADEDSSSIGPELKLDENGDFIINEKSLVQRKVDIGPRITELTNVGEEITYITSASFAKKKRVNRVWTTTETLRFYKALRSIGQDFGLISQMFPNRNRAEIKSKFKREEKKRPSFVRLALSSYAVLPVDLEMLSSKREKKVKENLKEIRKLKSLDDLYTVQKTQRREKMKVITSYSGLEKAKQSKKEEVEEDFTIEDFTNFNGPIPSVEMQTELVEELSSEGESSGFDDEDEEQLRKLMTNNDQDNSDNESDFGL